MTLDFLFERIEFWFYSELHVQYNKKKSLCASLAIDKCCFLFIYYFSLFRLL